MIGLRAAGELMRPSPDLQLPFRFEAEAGPGGAAELRTLLAERAGELRRQLLKHGALLFRGYPVEGLADFEEFVRAYSSGAEPFHYAGGASPRNRIGPAPAGLYTSTEYPPTLALPLHNELSYAPTYPRHLFFYCVTPPGSGGATTLGDSRRILEAIDPDVVRTLETRKIRYVRNLASDASCPYSWQAAFDTQDPKVVEELCHASGAEIEWREAGGVRISHVLPAITVHPVTGEAVWFNQADGFHPTVLGEASYAELTAWPGWEDRVRLNALYGDGSPMELAVLDHVRAVIRDHTIPHHWRRGDILVIDNLLAAHGRTPFSGERSIALAMT